MKRQRLITATLLALAVAVVAAGPAEAGKKKHKGHDSDYRHGNDSSYVSHRYDGHRHDGHRHGGHRHGGHRAYRPIVVPSRIAVHGARVYDPYYDRRAWYGPHRHNHVVYTFPVLVRPGVVAYAPHTYCDGHLIVRGDVVLDDYDAYGYDARVAYAGERYRWDDRVSGYVSVGGPNFRIGVGF